MLNKANFIDYLIKYESGRLEWHEVLEFLLFIYNEKLHEKKFNCGFRYRYSQLVKYIDNGVISDKGIDWQKFIEYEDEKIKEFLNKHKTKGEILK